MSVDTGRQKKIDQALARATFNDAADHFDDGSLFFWEPCGRRTVELAGIRSGDRVLDVCCGTGASALESARRVGPAGRVVGLDVAERLLDRARAKAAAEGLRTVEFRTGDMSAPPFPDRSFDAVVCVFGLYFARDLAAVTAGLWRLLAPGGTLAVTTWGPRALEPFHSTLFDALDAVRPGLRPPAMSWDRLARPDALRDVFLRAGATEPVVEAETLSVPWDGRDAWTIVLGSGYRLIVQTLGDDGARRLRAELERRLRSTPPATMVSDLLFARAVRP